MLGRKQSIWKRNALQGYFFILPPIVILVGLIGYPLIYNLIMSLFKSSPSGELFTGLRNFGKVFQSGGFSEVVLNTFGWTVINLSLMIVCALLVAYALNKKTRGNTVFQVLLLIPWVVPFLVSGLLWSFLFNSRWGAVNDILIRLHILRENFHFLETPSTARWCVIMAYLWKTYPYVTVLILAGMKSIPIALYEAAEVDGAKGFAQFWYITLPCLKKVLSTIILIVGMWTFNHFGTIYAMTGGGPIYSTETISMRIYKFAFSDFDFGLSAATSILTAVFMEIFCVVYIVLRQIDEKK